MSVRWDASELLQPISAEKPCGENLEDTPLLASFDAFRLYGRTKPLDAPAESGDSPKTLEDRDERPPDWSDVKNRSLEALGQSKDLRLLVHLGTALLRTDGLPAFVETVNVASLWLENNWNETYPLVDEDGILRRSALNCFADPIAVVDAVRRVPIVSSRQHGAISLRDIELATGAAAHGIGPGIGDVRPDESRINAAFGVLSLEELMSLRQGVGRAISALKGIDAKMRSEIGTEAGPSFDPLSSQLVKIDKVLQTQVAARPGGAPVEADAAGVGNAAMPVAVGSIRSRDDAMRALDAVAEYFRRTEPSSPVPLFCDRAKRLVSRDFLEVLADVAPEALGAARAAGGLKQE
jgi:type VI secretion system protein ImpA